MHLRCDTLILMYLRENSGRMGPFGGDLFVISHEEVIKLIHFVGLKHLAGVPLKLIIINLNLYSQFI